jgi:hypothetical protein
MVCLGALEHKGEGPNKNRFELVAKMALFDDGWRVAQ